MSRLQAGARGEKGEAESREALRGCSSAEAAAGRHRADVAAGTMVVTAVFAGVGGYLLEAGIDGFGEFRNVEDHASPSGVVSGVHNALDGVHLELYKTFNVP